MQLLTDSVNTLKNILLFLPKNPVGKLHYTGHIGLSKIHIPKYRTEACYTPNPIQLHKNYVILQKNSDLNNDKKYAMYLLWSMGVSIKKLYTMYIACLILKQREEYRNQLNPL